ncbi:unnamed protein product, partial [Heterotrigona itama]
MKTLKTKKDTDRSKERGRRRVSERYLRSALDKRGLNVASAARIQREKRTVTFAEDEMNDRELTREFEEAEFEEDRPKHPNFSKFDSFKRT